MLCQSGGLDFCRSVSDSGVYICNASPCFSSCGTRTAASTPAPVISNNAINVIIIRFCIYLCFLLIQGYERDTELTAKISDYEAKKAACVPVNIDEVTHVFYHSLVVDPELAFANQDTNPQAVGNNQWMTTVEEFNKITQAMYDRGYVLVDLHDLVEETTDENVRRVGMLF